MLIRANGSALLVDAGLSATQIQRRLALSGISPEQLDGILLTHEHHDHTAGLNLLQKRFSLPLYLNPLTADALRYAGCSCMGKVNMFTTGREFSVGPFRIRSFSVPHDAADPVGFVIESQGKKLAILTDLGKPTLPVTKAIEGSHAIYIEANYDQQLLERDTKRPWSVKQRISGPHGHLSNHAAAQLIRQSATAELALIVVGHLSEDCNTPELACFQMKSALADTPAPNASVACAPRKDPSPWWNVCSP